MNKSMYSLILSDEIIDRIDTIAKLNNKSRSSLIDQILAQYVSMITPEQRMNDLYELMQSHMERFSDEFRFMLGQRNGDFTAVSALKYKYNPTIRYNVLLYRDDDENIGEIRATLRTQNVQLLDEYADFIKLWYRIETAVTQRENEFELRGGVYRRLIKRPKDSISPEKLSQAITSYITLFNNCVKLYLSGKNDINTVCTAITQKYIDFCKGGVTI